MKIQKFNFRKLSIERPSFSLVILSALISIFAPLQSTAQPTEVSIKEKAAAVKNDAAAATAVKDKTDENAADPARSEDEFRPPPFGQLRYLEDYSYLQDKS